jgi:hypothetical protein
MKDLDNLSAWTLQATSLIGFWDAGPVATRGGALRPSEGRRPKTSREGNRGR